MQLYDTLRGHKAELTLPQDRPLTLYVCGVTPYDTTHVGHARTFLTFDLLQRYLRFLGAEVRYCQNVTDVDDPLFERAARDGIAWDALAHRETEQFVQDCAALHMIPPTYFPKASDEIPAMLPIIERLIELGHAYVRGSNVYYRVSSEPSYGAMARMPYDALLATANQRGNDPNDPNKEEPLDFVLWKASAPDEPTWPSPWGAGRPGWHIECTTMATRYLGGQIDIHGGGRDLIFPHHPSEIVQTEPVTGVRPFVQFWVHGGLVWLGNEKMSKSLGNLVFIRDALQEHGADPLRWYLLSFSYRDDWSYERAGVIAAEQYVERLKTALSIKGGSGNQLDLSDARAALLAALDDDLQSPQALMVLDRMSSDVIAAAQGERSVSTAQAALREMAGLMGFWAAER